jgi:hypothetical protein
MSKTFGSQTEKDAAIDGFGDITSENEAEFDDIFNAGIVEDQSEAAETPAQTDETQTEEATEVDSTTEDSQTEETGVDDSTTEDSGDQAATEPETFTITKEDLGKYKSPGELFKAVQEKDSLIERQGKKIQESIDKINEVSQKVKTFEESKTGQQTKETSEVDFDAEEKRIMELGEKYQKALKEDQYSEEASNAQWEFNNAQFQYQQKLAKALKEQKEAFNKKEQELKLKAETKVAEEREYGEIDAFAKKYKEFELTTDPKIAEKEYYNYGESVAKVYYNRQPTNWNEIIIALEALEMGSPTLIQNCEVAGVSIKPPSKDIENYAKISDLINFRDGFRRNPDGSVFRLQRYDPETGKNIPDKFPSLEAALEYRRVREGYYKKKASEAYNKGVEEAHNVAGSRDTNVLSNDSDQRAGTERSVSVIAKEIDSLDMNDPKYLEKLDALMLENEKNLSAQGST